MGDLPGKQAVLHDTIPRAGSTEPFGVEVTDGHSPGFEKQV